jgi:hypothetical protein
MYSLGDFLPGGSALVKNTPEKIGTGISRHSRGELRVRNVYTFQRSAIDSSPAELLSGMPFLFLFLRATCLSR